ncbi:uncharacterized protein LOC126898947 [Daktulosphaira vitifoliae]|uniref:uncharacterized protein LOC126898947 n=1 Tax=Daktulosphaira vitifoliae TaxID=58002 RepID=UPI0021AAFBF3|nr:uncharacterized protein LOC126898947 [Daktulosphaira vitifoliae]
MLFRFLILNFYNFWILNKSLMVFCSSSSSSNQNIDTKYIINAFNTICQQKGWLDITYKYRVDDDTHRYINTSEIKSEINEDNFLQKIPIINDFIIVRYTAYLKLFKYLLNSFYELCCSYINIDEKNFIYCSRMLRHTVSTSAKMFLKFLYVAIFIHNINVHLYNQYELDYKIFVTQIKLLYDLTLKKRINITFITIAVNVVNCIGSLINDSLNTIIEDLDTLNHYEACYYEKSVETLIRKTIDMDRKIFSGYIDDHITTLDWFYKLAIKDGYYDLGFDQVIVDNMYTCIKENIEANHKLYDLHQENVNFKGPI